MAAPTPRGYPTFDGQDAPAGYAQLLAVTEAVDADVQSIADDLAPLILVTDTLLTPSNLSLYVALGGGFQLPALRRNAEARALVGIVSNATSISFSAGTTYAVFQIPAVDAPESTEIFSAPAAGGTPAGVTVRPNGVIDFVLPAAVNGAPAGTWYLSLSGISWRAQG